MKLKFITIFLIMIMFTGCNQTLLQSGELLYRNPVELKGEWKQDNYLNKSKFIIITPENLNSIKKETRGIKDLNFNRQMGIYVTLGERPSGGYTIEIKEIRKKDDKLVVIIKAVSPSSDDFVTQVITYPYDLVKLPLEELKEIKKIIFLSEKGNKLKEKVYNINN